MKKLFVVLVAMMAMYTGCAGCASVGPRLVVPEQAVVILIRAELPKLDPRTFESFTDAAVASIAASYEANYAYENAGVIVLTRDARFRFTIPRTDFEGDRVWMNTGLKWSAIGYVEVGEYHTHPCLPWSHFPEFFSEPDIDNAINDKNIAIMGDLCTGAVHEWVEGQDARDNYVADKRPSAKLTIGHLVGYIDVEDHALERAPR